MKRRTFLQRIGSILAVLGVTETEWLRCSQALAQPTPRKLALLIGINQYQKSPSLNGCLTDVELQKELLIHRFGFQSSDILTLTEEQASREFIEAAFLDHLTKQAQPGDVVVFHFSGYGTRIPVDSNTVKNALVPANENQDLQGSQVANYLLEETLLLLLRSLPTERVTAVLDTSYYPPNTAQTSGLRIRARQELAQVQLASAELEFLQKLQTQAALKTQDVDVSPVVVLSATSDFKESAREVLLSGFSAGLFTYALTQQLWESTPATTIQVSFSRVASAMFQLGSKQQPGLISKKKNQQGGVTIANLLPDRTMGAEGAIIATEDDGKTAQVWLGGLPAQVLEYYGINSQLALESGEHLVVRSRNGLTAKAQLAKVADITPLKVGQLLQEVVRVLPRNINLTVALDPKLERIERVDATSAFATLPHVSQVVEGEQPADYIFGKLLQTPSRYGLFSLGGELIPNTTGEFGEAVKVAALRLATKLPTLLATKLWRLTENEGSSRLPVKVTLEIVGIAPRVVLQRETLRNLSNEQNHPTARNQPTAMPTIPVGSRVQYRIQNKSQQTLYLMLVGLNNHRSAIAFYPWQVVSESDTPDNKPQLKPVVIAPNETVTLPQTATTLGWMISGTTYECEHQLIFSTAPFPETLKALATAKYPTGDQQPISALVNPLVTAQALLQDLHNASSIKAEMNGTATDSYILDVSHWASLNFSFQVA
ncbi:Caspase domain-containing protein [Nostoc sp. PCC 7524]|uniref:caspase family protein n=1 Tax=Nostoc sp. (strain ATCC 29411 / PCC 7524) TaxID=28072 RepID=UPI00029EE33C|nr:caspase family protein [Nostoc sp. PCC 7524]AFY46599.1 Caspase domain-containing protein [Nostoc sp. PCC 7524]